MTSDQKPHKIFRKQEVYDGRNCLLPIFLNYKNPNNTSFFLEQLSVFKNGKNMAKFKAFCLISSNI